MRTTATGKSQLLLLPVVTVVQHWFVARIWYVRYIYDKNQVIQNHYMARQTNELPRTLLFQGEKSASLMMIPSYVGRLQLLRDDSNSTGAEHCFFFGSRGPFALRVQQNASPPAPVSPLGQTVLFAAIG